MLNLVKSFTFDGYKVYPKKSTIIFTYKVRFKFGITKTFTDRLFFPNVPSDTWNNVPKEVLEPTLQSLLLMIGINYWCVFRTKNICIEKFTLSREQANFWNSLYLNGLGEFFYFMKIDFRDLIHFPYDDNIVVSAPGRLKPTNKVLLLNGAGKDSILSAEILKKSGKIFDLFAFSPSPAHKRIGNIIGAKTISVSRQFDPWITVFPGGYPSVSTFTFIATLLSELLGYDSIVFSNERSADFGNLKYLGLAINHQWCKSSEAESMINDYINKYITPDISTYSLLRKYSELEIVQKFVQYPQYLQHVTSCNMYFNLPRLQQFFSRTNYWCNNCPKCIFLFASFSAFLSKKELINMFGENLYSKKKLIPLFSRILGISGTKPFDCVGEPDEMILAMYYASKKGEYAHDPVIQFFEENFSESYDFEGLAQRVLSDHNE